MLKLKCKGSNLGLAPFLIDVQVIELN